MNADDIQRQNEGRFALAREQIRRADRLQALLGLQAAALVIASATLLVAAGVLAALVGQDGSRVASALFLVLAALCLLAAVAGAVFALHRGYGRRPAGGAPGGRSEALFFDLFGTAGAFATPAEFEPAFRSALNEEMIGYALAELLRAGRAARRQRAALQWALCGLLLGFILIVVALALALLGA